MPLCEEVSRVFSLQGEDFAAGERGEKRKA